MAKLTMVLLEKMIGELKKEVRVLSTELREEIGTVREPINDLGFRIDKLENPTHSIPDPIPPEAEDDGLEMIGLMKLSERIAELEGVTVLPEERMIVQGWRERIVRLEQSMTPEELAKTLGEVAALRRL